MSPLLALTLDLPFLDDVNPQLLAYLGGLVTYLAAGVKLARRLIAADRARVHNPDPAIQPRLDTKGRQVLAGTATLLAWPLLLATRVALWGGALAIRGLCALVLPRETKAPEAVNECWAGAFGHTPDPTTVRPRGK